MIFVFAQMWIDCAAGQMEYFSIGKIFLAGHTWETFAHILYNFSLKWISSEFNKKDENVRSWILTHLDNNIHV